MPRGTARMKQWEADRTTERDATQVTVRCAHCAWSTEGNLGESRAAHQAHRAKKHPEIQPKPRRTQHRVRVVTSDKTLDDNIQAVREQGGAAWEQS